jgi:hypothetical protein
MKNFFSEVFNGIRHKVEEIGLIVAGNPESRVTAYFRLKTNSSGQFYKEYYGRKLKHGQVS